ncbi:hypothetical protein [Marinobacter daqiaonensis]|uniref:hypothetical protein n=1 Tax=Marinobacter daqiaonensis TaxID=650891 RepID=UPI0011139C19|nr:hypothetical protein [Marinobacter daqiaonensis]
MFLRLAANQAKNLPYFMSEEMLEPLPRDPQEAGSLLGLSQVPSAFDVYKISTTSKVSVYESTIAPFSLNGGEYLRSGGGTQILVLDRGKFTSPELVGE